MFNRKCSKIQRLETELLQTKFTCERWCSKHAMMKHERDSWEEAAMQYARNADYYKGLLDNIAEHFGEAAYISDDQSVQDEPLRAKMPDLVSELKRKHDMYRHFVQTHNSLPVIDLVQIQFNLYSIQNKP